MMQALFMQARLKNVSGMAAAKIAPAMDVITEDIAESQRHLSRRAGPVRVPYSKQ